MYAMRGSLTPWLRHCDFEVQRFCFSTVLCGFFHGQNLVKHFGWAASIYDILTGKEIELHSNATVYGTVIVTFGECLYV
jgi:hypothetical protein